ncbi:MAG TPA: hypothetical protein VGK19_09505 [Capsulimonadaceae bacterium]
MSDTNMQSDVFPGANQRSPSRAQYFTWINNTNEGATEAQTLINLEFFRWLRDQYGMTLDIYAFDAGAIDGAKYYGSTSSERFKRQFPRGFGPAVEVAASIGTRLGLWGGPDGFGDTPEEEEERIETMVSLCRDHRFELFKLDAVCGGLRESKQDAFVRQMTDCRKYSPDLILLNHRLDLGKGLAHATTFLWEGVETYIDVHVKNTFTASHNRAVVLTRGLPPELQRLTEDHGVCLSSCLDYWEDDLVLQAFNRCLILAPELYGNPWLLRDDEYPRLARYFNIHRKYRDILVDGRVLPEDKYGPDAVSRGSARTRLITLRNCSWEPVTRKVELGTEIGLEGGGTASVWRLHPYERCLGELKTSSTIDIEVHPFRTCLLLVTLDSYSDTAVIGCDFEIIRDVPGAPLEVDLLGKPGTTSNVKLIAPYRTLSSATLGGEDASTIIEGGMVDVTFPGKPYSDAWHRKLGEAERVPVPDDAEALYEATCFAGDNNAAEVRELKRSGSSAVSQVRAARDAFFAQPAFRRRFIDEAALFDNDPDTAFAVSRRWQHIERSIRGGSFRLDLGEPVMIDQLKLEVRGDYYLQPIKSQEGVWGSVSADLKSWRSVRFFADTDLEADLPADSPIRYVRIEQCPDLIWQVRGYYRGKQLDRTLWKASNLFATYGFARATHAWSLNFKLTGAPVGSYIAIAIDGNHGRELAYAALRTDDGYIGAPRRSPSYPANTWEVPIASTDGNYTYYFPITAEMVDKPLDAVVLVLNGGNPDIKPTVWVTAYPEPMSRVRLVASE